MKIILASIGLVAVGATSLCAQNLSSDKAKDWSVSGSLRGFYDDNYTTLPSGREISTWGEELSPSLKYSHSAQNTEISARYVYDLKHYDDGDVYDHSHQIGVKLDHKFTERDVLHVEDTFVVAQEPAIFASVGAIDTPLRVKGDNIRNSGTLDFRKEMSRILELEFSYIKTLSLYDKKGAGSISALLNRIRHEPEFDLRFKVAPTTTLIAGYKFNLEEYTSDDYLVEGRQIPASIRNNRIHTAVLGMDQSFANNIRGQIRGGASYVEYYNSFTDDQGTIQSKDMWSPYGMASLAYDYKEGCTLEAGVRQDHTGTDNISPAQLGGGSIVLDADATTPYVKVTHKITPKFTGTAMAQYQLTSFNTSGQNSISEEQFLMLSGNLAYEFTKHLSSEIGYYYDTLASDFAGRQYARNRVYFGIRANY